MLVNVQQKNTKKANIEHELEHYMENDLDVCEYFCDYILDAMIFRIKFKEYERIQKNKIADCLLLIGPLYFQIFLICNALFDCLSSACEKHLLDLDIVCLP